MALERKHIAIIVGSVLLATAIGIGIYLIFRKPSDQKKAADEPAPSNVANSTATATTTQPTADSSGSIQNGQVVPIFNEENELANDISQLRGKVLYPKRKYLGGWDYTNVRSSAEVNTDTGWLDPSDNLLTTIDAGTPIGTVDSDTTAILNEHGYRWFKVNLIKGVGFWGSIFQGFVRADTVTFQPYTK